MLFDLVDLIRRRRRLLYVAVFISVDFLLLSLCGQTLQVHRANIATRIHNSQIASTQVRYQSDIFSGGSLSDSLEKAGNTIEIGTLRATVATIDGLTKAKNGIQTAFSLTLHVISTAITTVTRAVVATVVFIVRAIGFILISTVHILGKTLWFTARVIAYPFVLLGRGVHHLFGSASGLTHANFASVIQPQNQKDNIPVITREQAQQATIIQENTLAVTPTKPTGSGGTCDSGAGNGGYPMEWCDARMDSVQTVAYSSDHINRECTSYAYWYFTAIEGHADFHVTGNANRWARTSNYPTHTEPTVGAIAVETSGYYGHVAIVQALAGQTYEGNVVPEGYVLVSEMNYDWKGHFRYSYSPLNKFSAYIYQ